MHTHSLSLKVVKTELRRASSPSTVGSVRLPAGSLAPSSMTAPDEVMRCDQMWNEFTERAVAVQKMCLFIPSANTGVALLTDERWYST